VDNTNTNNTIIIDHRVYSPASQRAGRSGCGHQLFGVWQVRRRCERDTGVIEKRWVSLKDLMFFADELPDMVELMEEYETNNLHYSMHEAREAFIDAWEDEDW
jgi:hypothetical protein